MAKYKTYHGRSRFHGIRIVLLVLLLAGLAALFVFVFPNYVSYDTDGNISLDLPFLRGFFASPTPTAPPSPTGVNFVIESPSPGSPEDPSASGEAALPSDTPSPQGSGKQIFIPAARLNSAPPVTDLRDQALAEGYTGVVIEYKREGAENEKNLTMPPETAALVKEVFEGSGLELTALISACVDNEKPRTGEYTALAVKHVSGSNFWDRNQNRWFDMYKPEVHTLIIDLCREALAAGFDRVLLFNLGFPYLGGIGQINYGNVGDKTHLDAVNEFLTKMRGELGDAPLDAVLFPETARDGREETAGQDAAAFTEAFDRLYVFDGEEPVPSAYVPILQKDDSALQSKIDAAANGYVLYSENGIY